MVRALAVLAFTLSGAARADTSGAESAGSVEGGFRGCDDGRACRFALGPGAELYRVVPEGLAWAEADTATARAVRDRLNALMSSMIHQHKRVELHALRSLQDGTYTARVTVNGADVARDPMLIELAGSTPASDP